MIGPKNVKYEAAVLVRITRLGVSSEDGDEWTPSGVVVMDVLTPEGFSLGTVQDDGERKAWLKIVSAIDSYFDLREPT
jgi:hypothetical protein